MPKLLHDLPPADLDVRLLIVKIMSGPFAFDTESEGPTLHGGKMLNVHKSSLAGFSILFFDEHEPYYIPVNGQSNMAMVNDILGAVSRTNKEVWAHNWKHDAVVMERAGFPPPWNARDSLIMMWLLGESAGGRYGLKSLAITKLDMQMMTFKEVMGDAASFSELPLPVAACYACDDVRAVRGLHERFFKRLVERGLQFVFEFVEMPLVFCLTDMEKAGMGVDVESLDCLGDELQIRVDALRHEWEWLVPDVLISSSVQVSDHFYGGGIWPTKGVPRGKSGRHSTGRLWVEKARAACKPGSIGRAAADIRLEYQDLSKYLSTFTHTLAAQAKQHGDGRLRCSFRQHGTATGRLSCASPNLQNIPARSEIGKLIRKSFRAPKGRVIVCADYSQIELRVLAHLAGEGELVSAYREGVDLHQKTADLVGCSRQQAKTINFATVYGARAKKLGEQLEVPRKKAQEFLDNYHVAYPEVSMVRKQIVSDAYDRGYVTTLSGRQRIMEELTVARSRNPSSETYDDKRSRWFGERIAFNTPVQGGAADIVKRAMLGFSMLTQGKNVNMVSQVHDELLVECDEQDAPDVARELQRVMESAVELCVPLVAEPSIGQSWGDCK